MSNMNKSLHIDIIKTITNWLNFFDFHKKIKKLSELNDGIVLSKLIARIIGRDKKEQNTDIREKQACYGLIRLYLQDACGIKEGISLEDAENGDENELGKIAFIVLFNGLVHEIEEFSIASDKLDSKQAHLIANFFELKENLKCQRPSLSVYEEFLSNPHLNDKKSNNEPSTPSASRNGQASLLSPMRHTSLNSPRELRSLKKYSDDDFIHEKRRLEKEIHKKDTEIDDLTWQLTEKNKELNTLGTELNNLKRKLVEFNNQQTIRDEFSRLADQCKSYEKELSYYIEKCKKYETETLELRQFRKKYEEQEIKLKHLNEQIQVYQNKIDKFEAELKRFDQLKRDYDYLNEQCKLKESDILKLIADKTLIENEKYMLNVEFNHFKNKYNEDVDELNGQNAFKDSEISLLKAQLSNTEAEYTENIEEKLRKISENETQIEGLTADIQQKRIEIDEFKADISAKQNEIEALKENIRQQKRDYELTVDEIKLQHEKIENELDKQIKHEIEARSCIESNLETERLYTQDLEEKLNKRIYDLRADLELKNEAIRQFKWEIGELKKKIQIETEEKRDNQIRFEKLEIQYKENIQMKDQLIMDNEECIVKQQNEIEQLQCEVEQTAKQIAGLVEDLKNEKLCAEKQFERFESEKQKMFAEFEKEMESNKNEFTTQLTTIESRMNENKADFESELSNHKARIGELADELSLKNVQLNNETAKLSCQLDSLQKEKDSNLEEFQLRLSEMESRMNEDKNIFETELSKQQARIGELNDDLDSNRELIGRKDASLKELHQLNEQLIQSQKNEKTNYENRISQLDNEKQQMLVEFEKEREFNEEQFKTQLTMIESKMTDDKACFETELSKLETRIGELTDELGSSKDLIVEKEASVQELQALNEQYVQAIQFEKSNYQKQISQLDNEKQQLNSELERLQQENESNLEEYKIQMEIVQNRMHEEKVRFESELSELEKKNSTTISQYEARISELAGDLNMKNEIIVQKEVDMRELQELNEQYVKSLEIEKINVDKLNVDFENEKQQMLTELRRLRTENELKEEQFKMELSAIENIMKEDRVGFESQLSKLEIRIGELSHELNVKNEEIVRNNANMKHLKELNEELAKSSQNAQSNYENQIIQMNKEKQQLISELERLQTEKESNLTEFTTQLSAMESKMNTEKDCFENELSKQETRVGELLQELNLKNALNEEYVQSLENAELNVETLRDQYEKEKTQLYGELERVQKEKDLSLQEFKTQIEIVQNRMNEEKNRFENELSQLEKDNSILMTEYETRIGDLSKELNLKNEIIVQKEGNLRELQELNEQLGNENSNNKNTISQMINEQQQLSAQLECLQHEKQANLEDFKIQLSAMENKMKTEKDYFENELSKLETRIGELIQELNLKNELNVQKDVSLNKLQELNEQYVQSLENAELNVDTLRDQYEKEKTQLYGELERVQKEKDLSLQEFKTQIEIVQNRMNEEKNRFENELSKFEKNNSILMTQYETRIGDLSKELNAKNDLIVQSEGNLKEFQELNDQYVQTIKNEKCNSEKLSAQFEMEKQQMFAELERLQKEKQSNLEEFKMQFTTMENKMNTDKAGLENELSNLKKQNGILTTQYETRIGELTKETQNLSLQLTQTKAEYQSNCKAYESNFNMLKNELEKEREVIKKYKHEVELKVNELHDTNVQLEKLKEDYTAIQLNADTLRDFEKCKADLAKKEQDFVCLKEYSEKYEEHYKKHKMVFEQARQQVKEKTLELEQLQFKHNELNQSHIKYQNEYEDVSEKLKAQVKENRTLCTQIDYLERRLKELQKFDEFGSTNRRQSEFIAGSNLRAMPTTFQRPQENIVHLTKTPLRGAKFFDDSTVQYSSPELRTTSKDDLFASNLNHLNEMARRQSTDSYRTIANTTQAASQQAFSNRFEAISENDFEDVFNSEKRLQQLEPDNVRLSILQTRNKQQKPHLQSSYPLETLCDSTINERLIREGRRDITKSQLNLKSGVKRPNDGSQSVLSPKKSFSDLKDENSKPLSKQQTRLNLKK